MSQAIAPEMQRALQLRRQIVRHLIEVDPDHFLERLPNTFREVARLAMAAVHELEPADPETDDGRLTRLLKESAAAAQEREKSHEE